MDKSDYVDVEFDEINEDTSINKVINGEPFYYTTTQVAKMLDEPATTIGYWSKYFNNLLDIPISNKNKAYTKKNIEELRFIKKLKREDGFSLKQIEEYCSEKGFTKDGLVDQSKPLAIKAVTEAIMVEVNKQMDDIRVDFELFKGDLTNQIRDILIESNKSLILNQREYLEDLQDKVCVTIDEVVLDKMESVNSSIEKSVQNQQAQILDAIDKREAETNKKLIEIDEKLRKSMENKKKDEEILEKTKNKGFFSRLFK
ncbi:MAG: helix-turn-helix domain-containing protein [Clostridium sp.]